MKRLALQLLIFPLLLAGAPSWLMSSIPPDKSNPLTEAARARTTFDRPVRPGALQGGGESRADRGGETRAAVEKAYGHLPLSFEINRGQYDRRVRFACWGAGRHYLLTDSGAVIVLATPVSDAQDARLRSPVGPVQPPMKSRAVVAGSRVPGPASGQARETVAVTLRVERISRRARMIGAESLPGRANYLVGRDAASWHTDIPTYGRVSYRSIYRGIDMAFYGRGGQLEYDFIVAPGTSPRTIGLKFSGIEGQAIDAAGNLVLTTAVGQIIQRKPVAYQEHDRGRQDIECDFVIGRRGEIGFRLGAYDKCKPFTIDPQISYSGIISGGTVDTGTSIAVDSQGNAYVAGYTYNLGFPTVGGLGLPFGHAFVLKLDPTGSTLIYSTRTGGSGTDQANSIGVDSTGNVYIAGSTYSTDFPTVNAFQPNIGAEGQQSGFVAKLNAEGSALVYSTYLGDEDAVQSIAVDGAGSAYVAGQTQSTRFPVRNPFQSAKNGFLSNCFVSKFDAGGALVYSTYLGGSGGDSANGIAVDSQGNAYVTGASDSLDFPLLNPLQSSFQANTLLKSSDQAASWVPLDTGIGRNAQVNGIAVDPHNAANVFIGTYGGVFKSTDRGVSWASASNGLTEPFITAIAVDPVNPGTLYATSFGTAFKSIDAGGSWQTLTQGTLLSSVA